MLNNNYICAVDIGSSKIAACVAQLKGKQIANIFFETMPVKGVKEGLIVDSIDAVNSLSKVLKNLKAKSRINFKFILVNISGVDVIIKHSRAILPLAERGNKVIMLSDIYKVNEQARILGSSLEEEIIHMTPLSYTIDSKSEIPNPFGLYSHKLEVDLLLVCVKLSAVQSLSRVVNQAGFEIKDLFLSGLVSSRAVLNNGILANDSQEAGSLKGLNLFCDIGCDITELLLFENGLLKDIEVLPFGGDELTKDLSEELKIPFDLAEDIKKSNGIIGNIEHIGEDKEILIKKNSFYKPIKQKLVSEIITRSTKSLCAKLKSAVNKKISSHEVNSFTVTGRTILLEGFIEVLENTLNMPVRFGRITNPRISGVVREDDNLSGQKYLNYLTCLGMICEALGDKESGLSSLNQLPKSIFSRFTNRIKEVYQEYF